MRGDSHEKVTLVDPMRVLMRIEWETHSPETLTMSRWHFHLMRVSWKDSRKRVSWHSHGTLVRLPQVRLSRGRLSWKCHDSILNHVRPYNVPVYPLAIYSMIVFMGVHRRQLVVRTVLDAWHVALMYPGLDIHEVPYVDNTCGAWGGLIFSRYIRNDFLCICSAVLVVCRAQKLAFAGSSETIQCSQLS